MTPDPFVRAGAARSLALHIVNGNNAAEAAATLELVVADRGRATGMAVAGVIADHAPINALLDVRSLLTAHPSASVRRLVSGS